MHEFELRNTPRYPRPHFEPIYTGCLKKLDNAHATAVRRAMVNILSTDLAMDTFAQVADGAPAPHPDDNGIVKLPFGIFGSVLMNAGLSQKARGYAIRMRENFDLDSIDIDEKAVELFAEQHPIHRRREFAIGLAEVVARLCHHLAATLFELTEGGLRTSEVADNDNMREWLPPMEYPPYCTPLFHPGYGHSDLFPRGAADVAGYWAEAKLFGGVVLFDRRGANDHVCKDMFLEGHLAPGIFRVSDEQLRNLCDFFMSTDAETRVNCLPIQRTEFSREYHPGEAVGAEIYRSKYDREVLRDQMPVSDVVISTHSLGTNPVTGERNEDSERREAEHRAKFALQNSNNPFPRSRSSTPAPEPEPYVEMC